MPGQGDRGGQAEQYDDQRHQKLRKNLPLDNEHMRFVQAFQ